MIDAYAVTRQLEQALCAYTGAPHAVCVNSGSNAIFLALRLLNWGGPAEIPKRTYVSVAQQIKLAGYQLRFRDEEWIGAYQIRPTPVWDCARRFHAGMYAPGQYQALSFASSKILGIEQGGCLLLDDEVGANMLRKMRFDGRTEGVDPRVDEFISPGYHMIMLPSIAAQLLLKLSFLPRVNADLGWYDYPDLSEKEAFK